MGKTITIEVDEKDAAELRVAIDEMLEKLAEGRREIEASQKSTAQLRQESRQIMQEIEAALAHVEANL